LLDWAGAVFSDTPRLFGLFLGKLV